MGVFSGKNRQTFASTCIRLAALGFILSLVLQVVASEPEPTESQCRPYIEKALKHQHGDQEAPIDEEGTATFIEEEEDVPTDELTETIDDSPQDADSKYEIGAETGDSDDDDNDNDDDDPEESKTKEIDDDDEETAKVVTEEKEEDEDESEEQEKDRDDSDNDDEKEGANEENEKEIGTEDDGKGDEDTKTEEDDDDDDNDVEVVAEIDKEKNVKDDNYTQRSEEDQNQEEEDDGKENIKAEDDDDSQEHKEEEHGDVMESEREVKIELSKEAQVAQSDENDEEPETEQDNTSSELHQDEKPEIHKDDEESKEKSEDEEKSSEADDQREPSPEEELTKETSLPENLRPRDHITKILGLEEDSEGTETLNKATDATLKGLKGLYDNAIKPLELLYKYRDLSNRHFGDPEIFSKPLILFMGPWSGGKSSTINYLLDSEFTEMALRTGAEPSPAYFNILMYGEGEEVLDGTQLAADWTFSGLQKFGQSLLDRLKGYKLPSKLLEKVNIVEIPGILEIRKQVQRLFPFNDACQWFIDRADIIFLVYDPSKLDVGPETEAILDQLKGREYQTRIILNKADQVKPEELMRVQGTLIWNISPLMSSVEPPIMYSTSLWSLPYESGAPTRLLQAQERAFLRDLREAIDKRVDNKIASARRFAVRVRNHAKMVDCYLTTYYNHKTFFGNRKKISDDIIENPQKYHIYEGLSTLTNISRYDLPDPDVYRDFFRLNPLYDFTKLSDTCTYFRGCPINKLDVAIAYDLPELVGKYKKAVEASKLQGNS